MKRLINKDVPFITYIIHDKNMKNGRTVTVYKPTQEYYILFELIKFRRLPSTFPDIGITVISEGLEPSPSDVSVTQDVLMDIKKDLSDAEIEELGAQEAEQLEEREVIAANIGFLTSQCELEVADLWIPVSERLPEVDKHVLVYNGLNYAVGWWNGDEPKFDFETWDDMFGFIKPTHWMPLPEPPEEERNDY